MEKREEVERSVVPTEKSGFIGSHDVELDVLGMMCPEPVMMLHVIMRDMQLGQVVKIMATDPTTKRDVAKFCQFLGHELLASEEVTVLSAGDEVVQLIYWVKKLTLINK